MVILDIWQKLQKRPRILKTLQNSPGKITEADPKLPEIADWSLSRTAEFQQGFSLIFWSFELKLDPKINPKH